MSAPRRVKGNSIMVIKPYCWNGIWCFDDDEHDLHREPFIGDTNKVIDKLTEGIDRADEGFRLIFSDQKFPKSTMLQWQSEDIGGSGNWYYCDKFKIVGWLCPALLHYFKVAPNHIFVKAEAL